MTTISTVAELEALPVGAIVLDEGETAWRLGDARHWQVAGAWGGASSAGLLRRHPSLRVVHVPGTIPPLHMVRCASDGCMDARALPAGAFYLCPQHRGHITLGRN